MDSSNTEPEARLVPLGPFVRSMHSARSLDEMFIVDC